MTHYTVNEKEKLIAFGLRLRNLRLNQNISQEELAELTALHRTYIGSVERGERNISFLNILKIADAFNVAPSLLIQDDN